MINERSYLTIQSWMRTELDLKGNELLVYAIIYGFSQTENQKFTGSLQYLADWCGATRQGVLKNLQSLLDKELIIKTEVIKNGVKLCEYSCAPFNIVEHPVQHSLTPVQHSLTNNIVDNIEENKISSKDEICQKSSSFLHTSKKSKQPNLYSRCLNQIDNFSGNEEVRKALRTFLDSLSEMRKLHSEIQFAGILKKLQDCNTEEQLRMINNSIEKGYGTFYKDTPRNNNGKTGHASVDIEHLDYTKMTRLTPEQKRKLKEDIANDRLEKF